MLVPQSPRTNRPSQAAYWAAAGRSSPKSLYSSTLVTFEDDKGAYDQADAAGFIRLNALRLRIAAKRHRK